MVSSAALFSAPVKDQFFTHLPNLVITDAIGSSEGGNNGMTMVTAGNTAMKSGPTVHLLGETVVFDENLEPVEPGSGVIGKIARSGDIPLGLLQRPEEDGRGLHRRRGTRYVMPGDYATVEADGSITLLGRGSIVINSGGEKIFPEEVESAVRSHPDVMDAIVCGAPDERWGQTVAAIVQPRAGHEAPSLEAIQEHCRETIAGYKVPRQLHVVDAVERSPSGKPDYPWAAAIVNAGARAQVRGGTGPVPGHRMRSQVAPATAAPARLAEESYRRERRGALRCVDQPDRERRSLRSTRCTWRATACAAVRHLHHVVALWAGMACSCSARPASQVRSARPVPGPPRRRMSMPRHRGPCTTATRSAPASTPSGVSFSSATHAWTSPVLDGQVYGEPLEATGASTWRPRTTRSMRWPPTPAPSCGPATSGRRYRPGDLPCGDISPTVGITGTPVLDVARGEIFAVADELSGSTPAHVLVGLNMYTGTTLMDQDVDPPGQPHRGHPAADRAEPEQRQRVFGYGGNDGDCSTYSGWVGSVPEGGGTPGFYQAVPIGNDGAVWMGGAAPEVDAAGNIWVATGNGSSSTPYDFSDSILQAVARPGSHPVLRPEQLVLHELARPGPRFRPHRRCSRTGPRCRSARTSWPIS